MGYKFKFLERQGAEWIQEPLSGSGSRWRRGSATITRVLKIRKESSENAKKVSSKRGKLEHAGQCAALLIRLTCERESSCSVLNSPALSANSSPSHKPSPFPEKTVQVGAAEGASSLASVSPEPLGRSAALRRTDFPSLMQVRPRTQRTPVGGDRQRLNRPPHRRGSSLSTRLWGGKPQEEALCGGGADGRRWTLNNWLIMVHYIDTVIIDQTTNGIRAYGGL